MGCASSVGYMTYKHPQIMPDYSHLDSDSIKINYTLYQKYDMPQFYNHLQEIRSTSIYHERTENSDIISHMGFTFNFPNLKILALSNNGISSLQKLYAIKAFSLQVLDLSQNQLTCLLPLKKFAGLGNLVNLNLSSNFITTTKLGDSLRHWGLCRKYNQQYKNQRQNFFLNLSYNPKIYVPQQLCLLQESDQRDTIKYEKYRSVKCHITLIDNGMIFKKVRFAINLVKPQENRAKGNYLEGVLRRFSNKNLQFTEQYGVIKVASPTKRASTF